MYQYISLSSKLYPIPSSLTYFKLSHRFSLNFSNRLITSSSLFSNSFFLNSKFKLYDSNKRFFSSLPPPKITSQSYDDSSTIYHNTPGSTKLLQKILNSDSSLVPTHLIIEWISSDSKRRLGWLNSVVYKKEIIVKDNQENLHSVKPYQVSFLWPFLLPSKILMQYFLKVRKGLWILKTKQYKISGNL